MIGLLIAAGTGLVVTLIGTKLLIEWLRARNVGQPIHSDVPAGHSVKAGTPTMGGVAVVGGAIVGYAVAHLREGVVFTRSGLLTLGAIGAAAVVGFADDWIKVTRERNLGLTKTAKTVGMLFVAVVFAAAVVRLTPVHTTLGFTRFDAPGIELGSIGWAALTVALIFATSNAVNLTDGLDGLAAGAGAMGFAAYTVIGFWALTHPAYQLTHAFDLAVLSAAMLGACVGFLWWNAAPARVFMGDTGSLAVGTALACLAALTATPPAPSGCRGSLRVRSTVRCPPGGELPPDRQAALPHGACPSPLRARRVARVHGHHQALDPRGHVHGGRARDLLRRLHRRTIPLDRVDRRLSHEPDRRATALGVAGL